jgi:hypothetical protein
MTPTNLLPSLRERAESTLEDIEKRFHKGSGIYTEKENGDAPAFAWGQGILLSAFVSATANIDARRYAPRLRRHFEALKSWWHPAGPVPGYNASRVSNPSQGPDRYYDDNAWLALALFDAYEITGEREYFDWAVRTLRFSLSGHDREAGGGLYWHEQEKTTKNVASTAPSAVAALSFAKYSSGDIEGRSGAVWARRLYSWLWNTLRDRGDGLYRDNINVATGKVDGAKWSYNSALVLRLELGLADRWGAPLYYDRAVPLADACVRRWYDTRNAILNDDASFAHLLCEALLQMPSMGTVNPVYRDVVRASLDTLWTRVRRSDGSYPKHWNPESKDKGPTELLWIASAARAYAYAIPSLESGQNRT